VPVSPLEVGIKKKSIFVSLYEFLPGGHSFGSGQYPLANHGFHSFLTMLAEFI
jgi:hypothetical protein